MHRLLLWLLLAGMAACSQPDGPPLVVTDLEITVPLQGSRMSAAYMALANHSGQSVTITRVSSPQFDTVELHETVIENDIARMRLVGDLVVAAGETVRLERGGKHLMLMGARGGNSSVSLDFYSGDALLLSVSATPRGNER